MSPDLKTAFVEQAAADLPEAWPVPRQAARRMVSLWLSEALDRCTDELFGHRFAQSCPVQGAAPMDYQHRVLPTLDGSPALLTGIRFKSRDVEQPFVELLAWARPIEGRAQWMAVCSRIRDAFSLFKPLHLRVRWASAESPPLPPAAVELDQVLVAARLSTLQARPRPWGENTVDVRPTTDLDFFDAYRAAMDLWRRKAGGLGREVFPVSRSELGRCLDTGSIQSIYHQGRWAGLIAVARSQERAVSGYCVYELFLDAPVRGKRRASVLQRRLADSLRDRGRDCLYGTIHRLNTPSRRTAERCGRRVIESWWFCGL